MLRHCLGYAWEEQSFGSKAEEDPKGDAPKGCKLNELLSKFFIEGSSKKYTFMAATSIK